MQLKFIDLFCGIGAFHQAMTNIGGECVYACDIDKDCRETYEENYGIEVGCDITKVNAEDIPPHDVLCAGFPCQSFSKAGNRLGFSDDTKGTLFFDVCRILDYHKPSYAILENVRNLAGHDGGNTWKTIWNSLDELGYNVLKEPIIFSPHYIGIPQHRERVFIMCIRKDLGEIPQFHFNAETIPQCDINDVLLDDDEITDLDSYRLTVDKIEWIDNWNVFLQNIKCDKLPSFPIWSEYFRNDVVIPTGTPKWKENFILKNVELYNNNKEFIDGWIEIARRNKNFFGSKAKLEWQVSEFEGVPNIWDYIMQIRPSGLRIKTNTYFPALVAITQTSIVGSRKRFLTPRECARLQSFPDMFKYNESKSKAYKQFGNSINVKVAELFIRYMLGDEEVRKEYS